MGMFCVLLSTLQAVGAAGFSMVAALSRQGFVYFPVLFILNAIFGLYGLVSAQPAAEIISLVILIFMVMTVKKRMAMNKIAIDRSTAPL
jgi:multidrug efflux pump